MIANHKKLSALIITLNEEDRIEKLIANLNFADEIVLFNENKISFGSPSTLINKDAFDNLFPKDIVNFNRNLQQFIINKN